MPASRTWILLINILFIAVIYIYAANLPDKEIAGFFISILHTAINLALAVILLITFVIQRIREKNTELLLSLCITFFLSTVLVVLLSFPACFVITKI